PRFWLSWGWRTTKFSRVALESCGCCPGRRRPLGEPDTALVDGPDTQRSSTPIPSGIIVVPRGIWRRYRVLYFRKSFGNADLAVSGKAGKVQNRTERNCGGFRGEAPGGSVSVVFWFGVDLRRGGGLL